MKYLYIDEKEVPVMNPLIPFEPFRLTGPITLIERIGEKDPLWIVRVDAVGSFPIQLALFKKPKPGDMLEIIGSSLPWGRGRPDYLQAEIRKVRFLNATPTEESEGDLWGPSDEIPTPTEEEG